MSPRLTPEVARARLRLLADELRAKLRIVEDGEDVHYVGPSSAAIFEAVLQENARHAEILEGWLRERNLRWDPHPRKPKNAKKAPEGRVKAAGKSKAPEGRVKAAGKSKAPGSKRHLVRLDVERVLRRFSEEDGKPRASSPPDDALLARVRDALSGKRDPADLTDAKLRTLVNNIRRDRLADQPPDPHMASTVEMMDATLVGKLGWERDPPLEPPPTSPPPKKRARKKKK